MGIEGVRLASQGARYENVTMTKLIKKNFTQRFSKAVMNVEPRINYTALNEPRMHYTTTRHEAPSTLSTTSCAKSFTCVLYVSPKGKR